eukprot:m.30290 g.30290  ORF g.30290 m.30290 type:complete len:89 (-) comp9271_c0_seq1:1791-2057(-)
MSDVPACFKQIKPIITMAHECDKHGNKQCAYALLLHAITKGMPLSSQPGAREFIGTEISRLEEMAQAGGKVSEAEGKVGTFCSWDGRL